MRPALSALARVHRLTVDDCRRMGEAGILGPDLRTEPIDAEIVEMPPIGHPHAGTLKLIANRSGPQSNRREIAAAARR